MAAWLGNGPSPPASPSIEVARSVVRLMVTEGGIAVAPAATSTICPGLSPLRSLGFAVKKTSSFPSRQITLTLPFVFEIRKSVPVAAAVIAPVSTVPPPKP